MIKRHGLSIDISSEFFQLRQNPSIGHQRLTAKSPTMSARHRWQIEAWGRVAGAVAYRLKVLSQSSQWLFRDSTHAAVLHAARKNATLRATCASISASSTL